MVEVTAIVKRAEPVKPPVESVTLTMGVEDARRVMAIFGNMNAGECGHLTRAYEDDIRGTIKTIRPKCDVSIRERIWYAIKQALLKEGEL